MHLPVQVPSVHRPGTIATSGATPAGGLAPADHDPAERAQHHFDRGGCMQHNHYYCWCRKDKDHPKDRVVETYYGYGCDWHGTRCVPTK